VEQLAHKERLVHKVHLGQPERQVLLDHKVVVGRKDQQVLLEQLVRKEQQVLQALQ
jgi:hypothetical protein